MLAMMLAILASSSSGAEPRLSVHLTLVAGHTVELSVRNRAAEPVEGDAHSAFILLPVDSSEDAIPNRGLWGPAHPTTGRPYDRATRVGPGGNPAPS